MSLILWIIVIIFVILAVLLFLGVCGLNRYVNDYRISCSEKEFQMKEPHRILLVLAHPDDEVMISGTLARLKDNGSSLYALYCTHGEDGPTGGLVEKCDLLKERTKELGQVGSILGYDSLEILDYPDRYLNTIPEEQLTAAVKERILEFHPDTVICFDNTIGLYGHTDHAYSGKITQALLRKESLGVKHMLIMTLPAPMISLAMQVSKTFRERYDPKSGLPKANYAVPVARYGKQKKSVIRAHKTQWQVMGDVQPLWDKIPYFIYYRIFSREYFQHIHL